MEGCNLLMNYKKFSSMELIHFWVVWLLYYLVDISTTYLKNINKS